MALRQLMLSRKIAAKKEELDKLLARKAELAEQRSALTTREAELEAAVNEITEETPEEERTEAEAAVSEWEGQVAECEAAQAENEQAAVNLQNEIDGLQRELDELNARAAAPQGQPAQEPAPVEDAAEVRSERKGSRMIRMMGMFGTAQQREALFAREDVKAFAQRVRQLGKEKRAVSGGEILIPQVMLPMLCEQVEASSKLLKYVNFQSVNGTAREPIMGTIPEGVWTEMCANLNELVLVFNDVEVDGYKVGGFIPVCNALLEDNDVNLVAQVLFALGRAIAIALDKAILYGTGTKMPKGIVTRLAETAAPANYPATARPWADLHTSNIVKITAANSVGVKLFQSILAAFGNAKSTYGAGGKFWAMNEKTHTKLVAEALNFNAAGALVAGVEGTMPVIGGAIEELDFIPDDNIIAGYGEQYLLAERAGVSLATSEHFMFTADKTVFKGTARYDGQPAIAEGFVVIGMNGATPATSATFAPDTANTTGGTTGG